MAAAVQQWAVCVHRVTAAAVPQPNEPRSNLTVRAQAAAGLLGVHGSSYLAAADKTWQQHAEVCLGQMRNAAICRYEYVLLRERCAL
jgi:hypothetical protein